MNSLISIGPAGVIVDGLTTVRDIIISSNPSIASIAFPALTNSFNIQILNNAILETVSMPALKSFTGDSGYTLFIKSNPVLASIDLNALVSSTTAIALSSNNLLTSIHLDALAFINLGFGLSYNPVLTSLSLPSLVTLGALSAFFGLQANNCPALADVNFPKYLPTRGRKQNFKDCALTEASVDHILARCVASANYTSGTVDLSVGTSSAPGTQGQLDKVALQARGVTVITN